MDSSVKREEDSSGALPSAISTIPGRFLLYFWVYSTSADETQKP